MNGKGLFIAVFEEPTPDVALERARAVSEEDVYQLSDHAVLLRGYYGSAKALAKTLGMQEPTTGIVLRLNGSYSGYHYQSLWDWLDSSDDE